MKDLYPQYKSDLTVLELSGSQTVSTLTVITQLYRKLSRLRHPDKFPPEEKEKFTKLFQDLNCLSCGKA